MRDPGSDISFAGVISLGLIDWQFKSRDEKKSQITEKSKLIVTVETIEVTEKHKGNRMANISKELREYERREKDTRFKLW